MELDSQIPTSDYEIDFDSLLEGFPLDFPDDDLDLWLSNSSPVDSTLTSPEKLESSIAVTAPCAKEIERLLMEDDDDQGEAQVEDDGGYLDEFLSGVLVDGSGSGSDSGRSEVGSPESRGSAAKGVGSPVVVIDEEGREEEDEEHINKKQKRQMRNRESAMQSRERRKLYVKDLEMKNKYLEAECRRLDYALRCCIAENTVLHQRLQKDGAPAARQESAVLFMESLLLGSLFWLVSIVCLFLVPGLQILNRKDASRLGRGLALEDAASKTTIQTKKLRPDIALHLGSMRRRYRASRTRIKLLSF